MNEYVPDFMEIQENRIERIVDERCLPNGRYECSCGNMVKLDETFPLSANPWAEPFCFDCASKYWKDKGIDLCGF